MDARGRAGRVADWSDWPCVHVGRRTQHLDDYRCFVEVRGSFREIAPRKTAENTVKHRDGGVGLVVDNHRCSSESSVVIRTLLLSLRGIFYGLA